MKFKSYSFKELLSNIVDNRGKTCPVGDAGLPLIATNCIKEHSLYPVFEKVRYVSDETYTNWFRGHPQPGDMIFVCKGSPGRVNWVPDPVNFCIAQDMVAIRADTTKVYPKYLFALLRSQASQQKILNMHVGSLIPHFKKGDFGNLYFELPEDLEYQKKVGDAYFDFCLKIESNNQLNQTLEEMAQAIFKSWFVDFEPVKAKMNGEQPEGMDAATASLFPEKLVESELGLIPEGWPVDQVGNHIDVTKGKSYKSAELQESTTALVTLKSFKRGGGYRMDGLKEYTGKYKPQQVIEAGDLVMSLTDVTQAAEIVGKPALVIDAPQYDTLVASLDVAILRPKETDAKQYFYGLMSTYRFHRYAESFATGTTVLHLSPKGITTFEFACPSAELVKKYHEFAAPIFAKIEANILESQELAKLRDTLLPKLLSGEIELGQTEEMAEVS